MKKLYFLFAALFAVTVSSYVASAQDTDDCMLYLSYYQEYYKQGTKGAKVSALPSWRKAYELCKPGIRQNLYIHGADLFRMLISDNAKNPEYRAALVDTLVDLHMARAQYYPSYAKNAYSALSKDVNNYLKNDPEKTYKILTEVVNIQGTGADPVTYVAQMNAAVALFKDGKLSVEEVINVYDNAVNGFAEVQKTDTTQNTRNLRATMENSFINSRVASCENLIDLFGARYDDVKDDITEVTKIVRLLASADECTDNDLYLKAATQMHALNPSAASAYFLFRLNSKKDYNEASKYLNEAIASDDLDISTRAQYNYELAAFSLKNGHYVKAVEAANTAISLDKSFSAKAYMIIGHAWMAVPCPGNEIESRAKYWVAVDYFNRAKAADAELVGEDADKQIKVCAGYYPDSAEAFMYDAQAGQSYEAVCGGMKATTTVRTRK